MAGSPYDYLPSVRSLVGAYAQALDELWDLPLTFWKAMAEVAYPEDRDLTMTSTSVNLPRPTTDWVQVSVSASRLTLTGGRQTPVAATINPERLTAGPRGSTSRARVTVIDTNPCGLYQVEFRGVGPGAWCEQTRTLNFARQMVDP